VFDRFRTRLLIAVAACAATASLVAPGGALATTPTPVACGELEAKINAASEGEVLELSEACATNVDVTNTKQFTLLGNGSAVLSPKTANTPIIHSSTADVRFTLEDLVFEKGSSENGGAVSIAAHKEAVTLREDTFISNAANNSAGAVLIEDSGEAASEPTVLEGNTFGGTGAGEGNDSKGLGGGGAYVRVSGAVRITHNSFIDNEVSSDFGGGGGLATETSNPKTAVAPVEISNNTFIGNHVLDAGGGAFISAGGGQTVTLEGNSFSENRISGKEAEDPREGAGLALAPTMPKGVSFRVVQAHNTFTRNAVEATERTGANPPPAGGGGEWVLGVDVQSTADSFRENKVTVGEGLAPEGGGLGVLGTSTSEEHPQLASFTGIDDLFLGNSVAAGGWGGAIYTGFLNAGCWQPAEKCAGTSLTLEDSTVYGNEVKPGAGSEGGALWGSANDSLAVENSIIFANSPAPQIYGYATGEGAPSFAYSNVCQEAGGPAVPTGAGDICANPLLEADGEETLASPTIDSGSNGLVPAGLSGDLAGASRILATRLSCSGLGPAIVDIGAFEYQHQGPVPPCAPKTLVTGPTLPAITAASQSNRSWREGTRLASISRRHKLPPLGTSFSFLLNEQANVSFAFTRKVGGRRVNGMCAAQTKKNRRKHACKRTVTSGLLSFAGHSGKNTVSFQGRISHAKKLRPGTYTLVITATNSAGQHSAPAQLSFTIVK